MNMTRVMDGVRPVLGRARPVALPKLSTVAQPLPHASQRYVVGMDGIRRPAPLTPRDMLARWQAPAADVAAPAPLAAPRMDFGPALAAAAPAMALPAAPAWQLPSLRMPSIGWKRPAMAFGLVATALVASGLMASALTTPRTTTARADSAAKTASATAPSPAAAAPAVAPTPQKAGLQQLLDGFAASAGGEKFGIVVKDLKTGETASLNPDRQMTSASLYKLFVAQRIYQRIDLGELTSGQAAGGGTGRTIDSCLTVMINISDNGCGRALGTILGWGAQNQALAIEGYQHTNLATPQSTSASDVAMLYSRLYNGTLVSPSSTTRYMDLLKSQRVNHRLPGGLPAGTTIAHKTGDLDGYTHDAGIVYGPKTNYLVVMMSGPWNAPGNSTGLFKDLSSQLWNYFEN